MISLPCKIKELLFFVYQWDFYKHFHQVLYLFFILNPKVENGINILFISYFNLIVRFLGFIKIDIYK